MQNKDTYEFEKHVHNHDSEKHMMVSNEAKKVDKKTILISHANRGPNLGTLFSFPQYN